MAAGYRLRARSHVPARHVPAGAKADVKRSGSAAAAAPVWPPERTP